MTNLTLTQAVKIGKEKGYKYLAIDDDFDIYLFKGKPYIDNGCWFGVGILNLGINTTPLSGTVKDWIIKLKDIK